MNAVTSPTEGVDTLSAWLTAYLAAPETATQEFFTVHELLQAAGMQYSHENLSAMARAAGRSGLTQARRRVDGAVLRAWNRPTHAFLAQQAAERLDQQEAEARDRMDFALVRHRNSVTTIMGRLWLETNVRDLVRHVRALGLGRGASSELCGKKFSGVIFDEIGPSNDRRTHPRGARP